MIQGNLQQAAAITGATLVGQPLRFSGVATDSRQNCAGRLFMALRGERTDGEKYVRQAIENGAVATMVTSAQDVPVPQLLVADTHQALCALARAWQRQVNPLTVAVTGSNGKTTVKNMLAAILSRNGKTHATAGNFNNEIGVPLTILEMPAATQMAVIEMGAAQRGDIAALTQLAPPHVAVVTNVSNAHAGRFGSLEEIAAGKSEIYHSLGAEGTAVINRDDGFYEFMRQQAGKAYCLTFGEHADSDVCILDRRHCVLRLPGGDILECHLPAPGYHNIMNAAAAVAAAWPLSVSLEDMQAGLEAFEAPAGRLQNRGQVRGVTLLDDSYNANPASVRAAIDVLAESSRPAWLVLGDMAELGNASEAMHREVGEYARQQGIDALWTVGPQAARAAAAMGDKGHAFQDKQTLITAVQKAWPAQGTVLVKASRSAHMEDVVNALLKQEQPA